MALVEEARTEESARDTLTIVSWNVAQGKHALAAAELVASWNPDVFCQQEVQPDQVGELADVLGMDAYPAAPTKGSRNNNVIFLKRDGPLAFDEDHPQGWAAWHAPANITVRYRDPDGKLSPRTLSLVCEHSCYWSAAIRLREAEWYHTLAKPGWMTIGIGDYNSYRKGSGPTTEEWEQYTDRAFYANRTYVTADGIRRSDDRPDREMLDAGYSELARVAVERLGVSPKKAMKPASGYRQWPGRPPNTAHGVDRGYHTSNLDDALKGFTVRVTKKTRRMSDHSPLIARYRAARIRALMFTPQGVALPSGHCRPAGGAS